MNRIRCTVPKVVVEYHRPRSLYCQAIRSGRLVCINYNGWRVIEPLIHGFNAKGEGQLFAFQHYGTTSSGRATGFKTFTIDSISAVEVLDVPLLSALRDERCWPPRGMKVHCSR
jgi:hypothetical protein